MISMDFDKPLSKIEINMLRGMGAILIVFIVYVGFALMIDKQLTKKTKEANDTVSSISSQIALVSRDIQEIQNIKGSYASKINSLTETTQRNL